MNWPTALDDDVTRWVRGVLYLPHNAALSIEIAQVTPQHIVVQGSYEWIPGVSQLVKFAFTAKKELV